MPYRRRVLQARAAAITFARAGKPVRVLECHKGHARLGELVERRRRTPRARCSIWYTADRSPETSTWPSSRRGARRAPTSDSAYAGMKPDQGPSSPPVPTEPTAWPPGSRPTSLPDQAHAIVHPLLAQGGYSYFMIWDGCGTVATTLLGTAFGGQRQRWPAVLDATAALIAPPPRRCRRTLV